MQQALQIAIQLQQAGRLHEAAAAYRQALVLEPNHPDIIYTLGAVLHTIGDLRSAIVHYQQALQIKPNFPEALSNLGGALQQLGQYDQAVAALGEAVRLRPEMPELHLNFSNALSHAGRTAQAIDELKIAMQQRPNWPLAHSNLGNALQREGNFDQAIEEFRRAIALSPDYADAHYNLGNALGSSGQSEGSIAAYLAAQRIAPDWPTNNSNLLFAIHFNFEDPQSIFEMHKKWNDRCAKSLMPANPTYLNDRSPDRRLRIGYVAPDFCQHCQSMFTLPLLSNHDHANFEIYCYADVRVPDMITERIRAKTGAWRSIVDMSDEQVAALIRADQIDILVDLTMHMRNGRPFLFARKPAPVQVTWLAYPSTTGLTAIDYRLTDPYLDPPNQNDQFYSERSIRLPHTFWCFDPMVNIPASPLPADSAGHVTFGCLNNFLKVNPSVLRLWSAVLKSVPSSRMIVLAPKGSCRQRVIDGLAIEASRIEFLEFQPRDSYLRTYHRIDIGLDTFPYNGHTTSLDAFWMGVPVVSLCGKTAASRAGFSQCSNLGLTELVANESADFTRIAVDLANDLPRLRRLRATLREKISASPLMDGNLFAKGMEDAFRTMWTNWCKPPQS